MVVLSRVTKDEKYDVLSTEEVLTKYLFQSKMFTI